ncbi:uncharacterized protein LOC117319492 [Pecten maximus]|uniref:uncharacterized protein LOC117319492 n=1 Tax=Pecten maximus TaxID=6579 RepID=UPI0014586BFD|nr:uncharacterized protein LOC117319492 [Pecten maximus]
MIEGYDYEKKQYLVQGFKEGFRIHYDGGEFKPTCQNLKSAKEFPHIIKDKLQKELKAGRIAGPFITPPYNDYHTSPIGVVPKKEPGKFRMIHHLSHPKGLSINDGISPESSTVQYATIADAIGKIKQLGQGCFLAKTDIESAFRIVPIHPDDRKMLGLQWEGKLYFDKCLPMGLSESCKIFEELSTALEWVVASKFRSPGVVHVLDDFLFIARTKSECEAILNSFQDMCSFIGIPLAPEKTFGPAQVLPFLGITLDSVNMEARLPKDKLVKCSELITRFKTRKKVTLKELQSLIGTLQFATTVVLPGRAFLRRLIDLTIGVHKSFHLLRLTMAAKADLIMWEEFLQGFNGSQFFLDERWLFSNNINFFTDSSFIGFGGLYQNQWFCGTWVPKVKEKRVNIAILELYPIVLAILAWGDQLKNKCIWFFTDNQALVPVINKQSARDPFIMRLIRKLVLSCLQYNILFKCVHVRGHDNLLADALSRLQVEKFKKLCPSASPEPTPVQALLDQELYLLH